MIQNTFIPGWYALLPSRLVKKKPLAIKRFGMDLVVWRQRDHHLSVFQDRCPHRGAKLSLGKVAGQHLQCPFHGFQFDGAGQCAFAPELNQAIPGLKASAFEVKEAFDMIWIYWGDGPATVFTYPELAELHHQFKTYSMTQKTWQSHMTYCIENQLDYTHLAFVHHNTIGRNFKMPDSPRVVADARMIQIYFDQQSTPALTFFFNNTWVLNIGSQMKVLLYFCPVDAGQTQLYLRTYRQFLSHKMVKKIADFFINLSNRIILKQDQVVVASQGILPSYLAQEDGLMRHDQAIREFRRLWEERLSVKQMNSNV
jgi:phenylpropionate dioxygenase-like ring-hydroxylating dioxygenase large terminal subunit